MFYNGVPVENESYDGNVNTIVHQKDQSTRQAECLYTHTLMICCICLVYPGIIISILLRMFLSRGNGIALGPEMTALRQRSVSGAVFFGMGEFH